MNSRNKQQKKLDKKMAGIWQSFRDVGHEKQGKLIDHTFSFHIDDIGAGWEYVHFVLDNEEFGFRISYIGPGVSDFVESMTSLQKTESTDFTWYDEPGEYTWLVSRQDDIVYVEAPTGEESFFLKYEYFREQILDGYKKGVTTGTAEF